MDFWTIVVIGIILFVVWIIFGLTNSRDKDKSFYEEQNLNKADTFKSGWYVGGQPGCDQPIKYSRMFYRNGELVVYKESLSEIITKDYTPDNTPGILFSIKNENIKDIRIEDHTSVENKITAGRILLVGVFALAWKKRKQHPLYFLIIEHSDGRFTHTPAFCFQGESASTTAHKTRSRVLAAVGADDSREGAL